MYNVEQIQEETEFSKSRIYGYIQEGKVILPEDSPIKCGKNKSVVCLTTKEIFNSIKDAQEKYNRIDIGLCCSSKKAYSGNHPETGAPLIWRYKEEYDKLTDEEIEEEISHVIKNAKVMNRKIICIETRVVFDTSEEAGKFAKVKYGNITACCKGRQKTAGGYKWMYYDEYLLLN